MPMIQVTIFSGHEGRVRPERKFYLTIFGGCTLVRSTVARQILAAREAAKQGPSHGGQQFFLTVFGAVEIKCPTMAEEFVDLADMMRGGSLSMNEWDRAMATLGRAEFSPASFTLFGGFEEQVLPSEKEEIDSLAIHRHVGSISEDSGRVLALGIGQREVDRLSAVRRALQMELA
jgi:hypothetical protein